jgi:geranyl-CoA carboxylase alpha subunit
VAPLDGAVTRVLVEPGALVTVGELLIVVEAMKMEHRIEADVAGSVANLSVKVGDQVKSRQLLCEIATGGEV